MIEIDRFGPDDEPRYELSRDDHTLAVLNAGDYEQLKRILWPAVFADPCSESLVPAHTKASLDAYAQRGLPVGGFLEAVLAHELFEAVDRADQSNARALPAIVAYIYNKLPAGCHGSRERYSAWLRDVEAQRQARAWAESKVL